MLEYNKSIDDYINTVKQGIKWKRARDIATRELSDHINDLYDSFLADGIEENKAIEMSIREMGSADIVAAELNSVHKPKTNWYLIITVFGLLVIGITMRMCISPTAVTKSDVFAILIGIVASIVLYYSDYTILIRKPRVLYWLLSGLTAISLVYELRNGGSAASYHYSFYLLLLFPIIITGIAIRIKDKEHGLGLFFFSLYFLLPICGAFLIGSLPALIYSAATYIIFTGYMINRKWISLSISAIVAVICTAIISTIVMAYIYFILNIGQSMPSIDTFTQKQMVQILLNAPFIGNSSEQSAFLQDYRSDYPLVFLAVNFGNVTVMIAVIAYMVLLYLMAKSALRQNTIIGSMIAWAVIIIIGVQFAFSMLCNLGIVSGSLMLSFPFLTGGGSFTVANFVLLGILLSVCRNEDIAKDWIKLKSKHDNRGETA